MELSSDIATLCESWWDCVAESAKLDQHGYAVKLLSILGWDDAVRLDTEGSALELANESYLLRVDDEVAAAVHFVMPGMLEAPSSVVGKGLDFCDTTRLLANATKAMNIRYSLISDLQCSYLYDTRSDELLLHADTANDFVRELSEALDRDVVEKGGLDDLRRHPRSHVARGLREWLQRWLDTLMRKGDVDEEVAYLLVDRMVLLRFLYEHDILKRVGWRFKKNFGDVVELAFREGSAGCGKRLGTLVNDLWHLWNADMFEPIPEGDFFFEDDGLAGGMLKELALMSRAKFDNSIIYESFNYGESTEKARIRMVVHENPERESFLHELTLATAGSSPLTVDLRDEGYRSILHWFDKLALAYDRLGRDFGGKRPEGGPKNHDELDLIAWSLQNSVRAGGFWDTFGQVCGKGLVVYYTSPRQHRTVRLLLYLHIIERHYDEGRPFYCFPAVEKALVDRPAVLKSDRQWYRRGMTMPDLGRLDVV